MILNVRIISSVSSSVSVSYVYSPHEPYRLMFCTQKFEYTYYYVLKTDTNFWTQVKVHCNNSGKASSQNRLEYTIATTNDLKISTIYRYIAPWDLSKYSSL